MDFGIAGGFGGSLGGFWGGLGGILGSVGLILVSLGGFFGVVSRGFGVPGMDFGVPGVPPRRVPTDPGDSRGPAGGGRARGGPRGGPGWSRGGLGGLLDPAGLRRRLPGAGQPPALLLHPHLPPARESGGAPNPGEGVPKIPGGSSKSWGFPKILGSP